MSFLHKSLKIRTFCLIGLGSSLIEELEKQKLELEAKQCYSVDTSKERYKVVGKRYDHDIMQEIADLSMRIDNLKQQEYDRRLSIYKTIMAIQKDTELTPKDTFVVFMLNTGIFSREEIAHQYGINVFEQYAIENRAVPIIYDYLLEKELIF